MQSREIIVDSQITGSQCRQNTKSYVQNRFLCVCVCVRACAKERERARETVVNFVHQMVYDLKTDSTALNKCDCQHIKPKPEAT
jgi:hypothetical protein